MARSMANHMQLEMTGKTCAGVSGVVLRRRRRRRGDVWREVYVPSTIHPTCCLQRLRQLVRGWICAAIATCYGKITQSSALRASSLEPRVFYSIQSSNSHNVVIVAQDERSGCNGSSR